MRIENYGTVYQATAPAEIEKILRKRHGDGVGSFWLSHGSQKYPVISLLVRGDLASLYYIPNEGHPGFTSAGELKGLKSGEDTTFFLNSPAEPHGVLNDSIISFSDALKAAQEFAASPTLPKSIAWDEL